MGRFEVRTWKACTTRSSICHHCNLIRPGIGEVIGCYPALPKFYMVFDVVAFSISNVLAFSSFTRFSSLSLYLSPNRSKCGRITIVYFTNSSIQSTSRSRLPLDISLLPSSSSVNCLYAMGMELWFGIANMRIHRPRIRRELTVLNDCEPPLT